MWNKYKIIKYRVIDFLLKITRLKITLLLRRILVVILPKEDLNQMNGTIHYVDTCSNSTVRTLEQSNVKVMSLLSILSSFFPTGYLWELKAKYCDALRDLVPFDNFKNKNNNHGRVSLLVTLQASTCNVTKSKTPMVDFHIFYIVQMVPNRAKRLVFLVRRLDKTS